MQIYASGPLSSFGFASRAINLHAVFCALYFWMYLAENGIGERVLCEVSVEAPDLPGHVVPGSFLVDEAFLVCVCVWV